MLLAPVMPAKMEELRKALGYSGAMPRIGDLGSADDLPAGRTVTEIPPLFPRIVEEKEKPAKR